MEWKIPLIDLRAQYLSIKDEIDEAVARVHVRGNYVMGEEVGAFEEEWAKYCGAKYCVGVSSGTDALYLTLRALPDYLEYVLTTPFTFFATTQAVLWSGKRVMFMDVEKDGNINLSKRSLTGHDIAIPVHLYGRPAYIPFSSPGIIIEDSAQAHGLPLKGKVACFSFYPTKNLGAMGQAGAVVTSDRDLADKIRELRTYGERERFVHYGLTGNHRMDELQAAILRAKLPHLDQWNLERRRVAATYWELLKPLHDEGRIKLPDWHVDHKWHIFAVRTPIRDSLASYLKEQGVQTAVRYPVPMHLQPALKFLKHQEGDFPEAEAWARENLSLPIYPEITESQVEYVCEKIREWVGK